MSKDRFIEGYACALAICSVCDSPGNIIMHWEEGGFNERDLDDPGIAGCDADVIRDAYKAINENTGDT